MKRIFAAIKIVPGEEFMKLYYSFKQGCKYDRINWVDPQNIHITLKFFGETPPDKIPEICHHLQQIAGKQTPFKIELLGTGVFGSYYKPRVIWIGIKENADLKKLGMEVLTGMDVLGFQKDRQNFVPHLTLGRIKNTDNKDRFFDLVEKHKDDTLETILITDFHLFESKLSSEGPTYSILESFGFGS